MHASDSPIGILAIVPRQQCWDLVVNHQQYYMPVTHLSSVADASFLAFYMPGWHASQPRHITHTAGIQHYTLQRRIDIFAHQPHHPRAYEHYVVFDIINLAPLTPAIPSPRWHRISIHRITTTQLMRLPYLGHPAWQQHRHGYDMAHEYS